MTNRFVFLTSAFLGISPAALAQEIVVDRTLDTCGGTRLEGTLRAAIEKASATPEEETIVFDRSLSGQSIGLCGCLPEVIGHVTIDASKLDRAVVIDAGNVSQCEVFDFERGDAKMIGPLSIDGNGSNARAMHIGSLRRVSLNDVSIARFDSVLGRGTIYNEGVLEIAGGDFEKNRARAGGAIHISGSRARTTIDRATFRANRADTTGGALYVANGASLTVSGSFFTENYAVEGAAIYLASGKALLATSQVTNNIARSGAAIDVLDGALTASGNKIGANLPANCRLLGRGAIGGECPR